MCKDIWGRGDGGISLLGTRLGGSQKGQESSIFGSCCLPQDLVELLATLPALSILPATGIILSSPAHSLGQWALRNVLRPRLQEGCLGERIDSSIYRKSHQVTTLICTMQGSPSAPPESTPEGKSINSGGSNTGRAGHACKGDDEILAPGLSKTVEG